MNKVKMNKAFVKAYLQKRAGSDDSEESIADALIPTILGAAGGAYAGRKGGEYLGRNHINFSDIPVDYKFEAARPPLYPEEVWQKLLDHQTEQVQKLRVWQSAARGRNYGAWAGAVGGSILALLAQRAWASVQRKRNKKRKVE